MYYLFSALTRTVHIQSYCYPSSFPCTQRQNCDNYNILGRAFVFPVDISRCTALSSVVSQQFPLRIHFQMRFRKDFVSAPEAEDSHTTRKSAGVIAISVDSLVTKIFVLKGIFWPKLANK